MTEVEVEQVYLAYLVLCAYKPQNDLDKRIIKNLKTIITKYSSQAYFT